MRSSTRRSAPTSSHRSRCCRRWWPARSRPYSWPRRPGDVVGARDPRLALLRGCLHLAPDHRGHPERERHAAHGAGARARLALPEQGLVVALVGGFIIALKLFFWPLLVWLVATRRYRAAALTAAASLAFVFVPWAGIGFAGLGDYVHLLRVVARQEGADSYSLAALVHYAVPNWTAAVAVETPGWSSASLRSCLMLGRRGRDRDAFSLAIPRHARLHAPARDPLFRGAARRRWPSYRPRFGAAWLAAACSSGARTEANNGTGLNTRARVRRRGRRRSSWR